MMKKITQKLLFFTIAVMGVSLTSAQVPANGLWYPVGNTIMSTVTTDADNGDGVGDGALFFDGQDTTPDLGAKFTFNGTMEDATTYDIATTVYNTRNSYVNFIVSLYNKTDGVQLAASSTISLAASTGIETISLSYTAVTDDAGDVLELRYIRVDNNSGRDFAIDNASLNGAFVTEVLQAVSPDGTFGIIDADGAGTVTQLTFVNTDGDNGDGTGDGAIFVDGRSTNNPQGAKYILTEKMVNGKRYKFESTLYKPSASYARAKLQLYNATDNNLLATSGEISVSDATPKTGSVTYDAVATDAGDILELRWLRTDDLNTARDIAIDVAKINDATITISAAILSIADNVLTNAVSVYPNPANFVLNISTSDVVKIKNIKLIDLTGKVLYNNTIAQPITLTNYAKGLYILKIESQEGGILSKKVIIN